MKPRIAWLETLTLALLGLTLLATALLGRHLELLNAVVPSRHWADREQVSQWVAGSYGAGFLIAAAISGWLIARRKVTLLGSSWRGLLSLGREMRDSCRWFRAEANLAGTGVWLMSIVAVAAGVRCAFLSDPLRYDEAYTFMQFVNNGVFNTFHYEAPNNHVLHTLLVRLSVSVWGGQEAALRLPALTAGLLTIPVVFGLARLLTNSERSGYVVAAMAAVWPYLILFDSQARGYSLLILLSLLLVVQGLRYLSKPSPQLTALLALTAALGLFDLPTFVFPAAGIFGWLTVLLLLTGRNPGRIVRELLLPCGAATLLLTAALYTPVFIASNGVRPVVANRFVLSLPWTEFFSRLPAHLAETGEFFRHGVPAPAIVACLSLMVWGLAVSFWNRRHAAGLLWPSLLVGGAAVLLLKHSIPFARTWIYLLPFSLLLADAGLTSLPKIPAGCLRWGTLFLATAAGVSIIAQRMVAADLGTGYFPEAPVIVRALAAEAGPDNIVLANPPASAPVSYYLWRFGVPNRGEPVAPGETPTTFYIVKPSIYSLRDLTTEDARLSFRFGDAELYRAEPADPVAFDPASSPP